MPTDMQQPGTQDLPGALTAGGEAQALCLLAFVSEDCPLDAIGQEGRALMRIVQDGCRFAAIAAYVPLADYCGEAAEANLADLTWLTQRTARQFEVLQGAMRASPVFPMPFGTLFQTLDSLTTFMTTHAAVVADFLDAVSGREEWGLKAQARLDDRATLEAMACRSWPEWSSMQPGTRYLRLRRDRASLVDAAREQAVAFVADRVAEWGIAPGDVRALIPRGDAADDGAMSIASYALLVPNAAAAELRERVAALAQSAGEHGITFALSGPWPPFSFRPSLG